MNKHFFNYASIALCALNAVVFGGGLNLKPILKPIMPSTYLGQNGVTAVHVVTPLVFAAGIQKIKPEKIINGSDTPFRQTQLFDRYCAAMQVAAVGHSVGTVISQIDPAIGSQIVYLANHFPVLCAASDLTSLAAHKISQNGYYNLEKNTQNALHGLLALGGWVAMNKVIDKALEMTGLTEKEEVLK